MTAITTLEEKTFIKNEEEYHLRLLRDENIKSFRVQFESEGGTQEITRSPNYWECFNCFIVQAEELEINLI